MRGKTAGVVLCAGAIALGAGAGPALATGLDTSFYPPHGFSLIPLSPGADRFQAATAGPNGSTYAVGFTTAPGSTDQQFAVAHIDAAGKLDPAFGTNGVAAINVVTGGNGEAARGVAVQSNGKIVISGQAESTADPLDTDIYAARFNANGTIDPSFGGAGTGVATINLSPGQTPSPTGAAPVRSPDNAWGLAAQGDDKLVVFGARGTGQPGTANATRTDRDLAIIRLTANGTLDPTFGTGGVTQIGATINDAAGVPVQPTENPRNGFVQPDGKIVASGYGAVGGLNRPLIARLNADGSPDASFGSAAGTPGLTTVDLGAGAFAEVYTVGLQGTSYVTIGYGAQNATSSVDAVSLRFKGDGSFDSSYGSGGAFWWDNNGRADRGRNLNILPDGRVFIVGSTETAAGGDVPTNALALLLSRNGKLDTAFGTNGAVEVDLGGRGDAFFGSFIKADGKGIAVGYKGAAVPAEDEAAIARFDLGVVTVAPTARITSVRTGAALRRGPAALSGTVAPGATKVTLRVTRNSGKARGLAATVADGTWRVKLAKRLRSGRYRVAVVTTAADGTTKTSSIRFSVKKR